MVPPMIALLNCNAPAVAALEHLRELHAHLSANIKGQNHVIDRTVSVLTRGEFALANPRRPRGSFLFVGPTGVGKTELTNVFTKYLFKGRGPLRFDMSEYQLQKSVEKLIGENRNDTGLLGQALSGVKQGTLLFDEIEKAHPLVLNLFLQILEDARITFATGETADLSGFYVVFTSNIGSGEAIRMESTPFASVERTVLMRVRDTLRPELLGRINETVVFARLDYTTQREICMDLIAGECARLASLGHHIEVVPEVVEFLVRAGYHSLLGARPMRGAIERLLQESVAKNLLAGGSGCGRVLVDELGVCLILVRETSIQVD